MRQELFVFQMLLEIIIALRQCDTTCNLIDINSRYSEYSSYNLLGPPSYF